MIGRKRKWYLWKKRKAWLEDVAKKQELRKRLFKPTSSTAGSTKMRVFNALASPRKRAGDKTRTRQGDNSKQMESKGPLNPKNGTQKP